MARFGGNEFSSFSVPLVFDGRYFVLELGNPALLSVFIEREGEAVFEVLKDKAVNNLITEVVSNATGVITVTDNTSGKFLYKVRPSSETSIAFGKIDGGEISARVSDRSIQVGGVTVENNQFHGAMAGVVVQKNGGVSIGAPIPPAVLKLLRSAS
jgi:hypothetical protein